MSQKIRIKKKTLVKIKRRPRLGKKISREYERAIQTAKYYGYFEAPGLEIEREDLLKAKVFKESHTKEVHPFREDEFKRKSHRT